MRRKIRKNLEYLGAHASVNGGEDTGRGPRFKLKAIMKCVCMCVRVGVVVVVVVVGGSTYHCKCSVALVFMAFTFATSTC